MVDIISISPGPLISFAYYIRFRVDEIDGIAEWASNTFDKNFVILELASKIVAGGATDNRLAWAEGWNKDTRYATDNEYELRCSENDATLFLLKYKEKE